MKLSLEASRIREGLEIAFDVESVSPSGLLVLTTNQAPEDVNEMWDNAAQESPPLTFLFEKDGTQRTLQASLVWADWSEGAGHNRLELIIDTTGQGGWLEVSPQLAEG